MKVDRLETKLFPLLLSPLDLYFASHVLSGIAVTEMAQHSINRGSCFLGRPHQASSSLWEGRVYYMLAVSRLFLVVHKGDTWDPGSLWEDSEL